MGSRGTTEYSAKEAAVDPAVAGIAATEFAEAVAMQEAAEHYRHRCLDVGLDQLLQWWLEMEAAEWAQEEARHTNAECSEGVRLGDEGRVWQQWKAVTGVWKAAATKAAACSEYSRVNRACGGRSGGNGSSSRKNGSSNNNTGSR